MVSYNIKIKHFKNKVTDTTISVLTGKYSHMYYKLNSYIDYSCKIDRMWEIH